MPSIRPEGRICALAAFDNPLKHGLSTHARILLAAISFVVGVVLAVAGIAWSSASVERAFLGQATGALQWGPDLFRALLVFHGAALIALGGLAVTGRLRRQRPAPAPGPRSSAIAWGALVLLCGIALALRLWRLDTDLWLDEVFTLTDFLRRPWREIVASFPSQNQHPLYSLLGRLSVVAFGESAATVRLPAVLFGVGSIWALFMLGRRVIGTRGALLSCALMTFSYHHVWFSQNARGYIGLLFFGTLATWLWIEATGHGTPRRWTAYGISAWLGVWMHMTMVFVLAAHGVVYAAMLVTDWMARRPSPHARVDRSWRWLAPAVWIFAGTITIQVHALALPEFLDSALHEVSLDSAWVNPWWVLEESLRRLADGGLGSVIVIAALVPMAIGFGSIWRRDWRVAVLLIAPALLGGGTMLALGHNLWPRFFFFCMGFFILIAVQGALAAPRWIASRLPRWKWAGSDSLADRIGTAGCLLLILVSMTTLPRSYLPKQDFSGARRWIDESRRPGDEVVAIGLAGEAYHRYYAPDWTYVKERSTLEAIQRDHRQVWLVYTLPVHAEAWLPEIWSVIQREYEVVRVFPGTLGGGDVVVCRWQGGRAG